MPTPPQGSLTLSPARRTAATLGFYVAILIVAFTLSTFALAILTPPLSGPYCTDEPCFEYPYLDAIGERFPRDYYWMYPAMVLTLLYLALMVCIHYFAPEGRRPFTHLGLLLAAIATGIIVLDYFVQVSVIQTSLEAGETDGIALLTQFNPHGPFIALEDIGYLLMGVSFAFAAPAFIGASRLEQVLRVALILGAVAVLVALIGVALVYGIEREYRFEVFAISIDWLVLIIAGALLAPIFWRAMNEARSSRKAAIEQR